MLTALTQDQVIVLTIAVGCMVGFVALGAAIVDPRPLRLAGRHVAGRRPPVDGARSAGAGAVTPLALSLEDRWRAVDAPPTPPTIAAPTPRPYVVPGPPSPAADATPPATPTSGTSVLPPSPPTEHDARTAHTCRVCRDGHEVVGAACFLCGTPAARPFVLLGGAR